MTWTWQRFGIGLLVLTTLLVWALLAWLPEPEMAVYQESLWR